MSWTSRHTSELETAAAHWDRAFGARASALEREASYALASRLYQRVALAPHFAPADDWVDWVRRTVCPRGPVERALVLGCGLGDGLLDFRRRGIARRLHGVDISATAIEKARAAARAEGAQDAVTFEVGDFHEHAAEAGAFDLVVMVMALHHALDLGRVLERIDDALAPDGRVVVNEYVGPSRWQFTNAQLVLIKALLTVLPRTLRRRSDGSTKGRIGRPTIDWMLRTDPSEAARSAEIGAAFARRFELVHRIDYGGGVAIPVLDEIIASFREDDERAMAWLRRVVRLDEWAWRSGLVPSANAVLVGAKRRNARAGGEAGTRTRTG